MRNDDRVCAYEYLLHAMSIERDFAHILAGGILGQGVPRDNPIVVR